MQMQWQMPRLSVLTSEYVSLQVNSGFFYSSAEQRERLVRAERQVTTERVHKIIDLKREVGLGCQRVVAWQVLHLLASASWYT
jgi:hypothetical protein